METAIIDKDNILCSYYGEEDVFEIPYGVKIIGSYSIAGNNLVKIINIPSSVEIIEDSAFYMCKNLVTVTVPSSVKSIGIYAFTKCNVHYVYLNEGLQSVDKYSFHFATKLKYLYIPSSLIDIGYSAFSMTYDLENIYVNESNPNYTSLDGVLYTKDLSKLIYFPAKHNIEAYKLPDETITIEDDGFNSAFYLKEIDFNNVKKIGFKSLWDMKNINKMNININSLIELNNPFGE